MPARTTDQPIIGNPLQLHQGVDGSFAKPGELIEIRGGDALTQADKLTFNLLIVNAWPRITEKREHVIRKSLLRGNHESTDRLNETMQRLRSVEVQIRGTRDGKAGWWTDHILGKQFTQDDPDGNLYYTFTDTIREIITNSDHWGRLQAQVMLALSSKYALALYEMVQKRAGLRGRFEETLTLDDLRAALGVPPGKLLRYPDLRRYCLEPAVAEVDALSSCHVRLDPVKEGRSVGKIKLRWFPKTEESLKAAHEELQRHKAGRKARITGTVEAVSGQQELAL